MNDDSKPGADTPANTVITPTVTQLPDSPQQTAQAMQTPAPIAPAPPPITQNSTPRNQTANVLEVTGLILGVLLLVSMFTGVTVIAQFSLFVFAIVGIYAVFMEMTKNRQTGLPSTAQLSANYTANEKKPIKSTTVLKVATISVLYILFAIFVLPIIGIVLLILAMLVLGGGQGT